MRQWQTDFWSLCHMNIRMHPAASWNRPGNWALMSLKRGQSNTQGSLSPTACVSQTVHWRRWRGTAGLAKRPCSMGRVWEPSLNCTKARRHKQQIAQDIIRDRAGECWLLIAVCRVIKPSESVQHDESASRQSCQQDRPDHSLMQNS